MVSISYSTCNSINNLTECFGFPLCKNRGGIPHEDRGILVFASQFFQAVFSVLKPAGALGDIFKLSAFELRDDVVDVFGFALNGGLAGRAAETAISRSRSLVVI